MALFIISDFLSLLEYPAIKISSISWMNSEVIFSPSECFDSLGVCGKYWYHSLKAVETFWTIGKSVVVKKFPLGGGGHINAKLKVKNVK